MSPEHSFIERKGASVARLIWMVLAATTIATIANAIFYFILTGWLGLGLMFPSQTPQRTLSPMPVGDVIIFSVIFALGAGIVFVVVTRVARRPVRTYVLIAAAVLLLSFALPLTIPSPPVAMIDKLSLVAMHIVGAFMVVGTLIGLSQE